jgi:hypothetical protein
MRSHIGSMDRRTFNTTLIGGTVDAAFPVSALAKAAQATKIGLLYAWAVAIARAQNRASPALFAQQLGISKDAATERYRSMIANGVIRAPMFGGLARAAQSLFKGGYIVAADTQVTLAASAKPKDMQRAFDKFLEDGPEPEDQAT